MTRMGVLAVQGLMLVAALTTFVWSVERVILARETRFAALTSGERAAMACRSESVAGMAASAECVEAVLHAWRFACSVDP